jgi:hypothetical protein
MRKINFRLTNGQHVSISLLKDASVAQVAQACRRLRPAVRPTDLESYLVITASAQGEKIHFVYYELSVPIGEAEKIKAALEKDNWKILKLAWFTVYKDTAHLPVSDTARRLRYAVQHNLNPNVVALLELTFADE